MLSMLPVWDNLGDPCTCCPSGRMADMLPERKRWGDRAFSKLPILPLWGDLGVSGMSMLIGWKWLRPGESTGDIGAAGAADSLGDLRT